MDEIVKKTVDFLKSGKTILYPTDTIWGIGCDATNVKAIQRVYKLKQRTESKSLIVLISKVEDLKNYMSDVPKITYDLIKSIETPLTIIYPNAKNLAKNVIASDKTIAIRVVKNEFCQKVIELFGKPIVSTSANVSGEKSPIYFNKISAGIIDGVDYVVEFHHDSMREVKPSMIIKLETSGEFKIIRK